MLTVLKGYRSILAAMDESFVISITDHNGTITYVNDHFLRTSMYSLDEVIGRTHSLVKSGYHPPQFYKEMWQTIAVERIWRGEVCNRAKDGSEFWLDLTIIPVIMGDDDEPCQYLGIGHTITNRKLTERKLARTLRELGDIKQALDVSSIVAITDRRGVITYVNDKFLEISGYTLDELIGNTHKIVNSGHHPSSFFREMWQTISKGEVWSGEIKNRAKDGQEYWVSTTIVPFLDEKGKPYQYVSIRYDITERIRAQEQLEEALRIDFRKTIQNLQNGIFKLERDKQGNIVYTLCEGKLFKELGLYTEKVINRTLEEVHGPELSARYMEFITRVFDGESVNSEVTLGNKALYVSLSPMDRNDGMIDAIVGSVIDITERKEAEKLIYQMAHYDPLTDLPNRTLFNKELSNELERAKAKDESIAILFMDLDRFKVINDTLGHSYGDRLLRAVADRLRAVVHHENSLISRLGGDEFTFFFPDTTREEAGQIAEQLLEAMSEPFALEHMNIYVTPSIGISMYPDDGDEIEVLLKNADSAMYHAKERGKNNYQFFSERTYQQASLKLRLESELYRALEQNQLVLEYQPVVDLERERIAGFEALIRWEHPELGRISPMQFIPMAEETGLIVPIGEWVLREACRQTKQWHDQGMDHLSIGVNISWRQFVSHDFCDTVERILEETGLDPQYVELEITESVAHDADYAIRMLERLKQLGVTISIDDFGTGYSSLSYLSKFPIDRLKIDQSFIRDLNDGNRAIIKTIIDMAHNMNISVVAEGVEIEEHLDFLKVLRCPKVQGYYFSKPLKVEAAEQLLKQGA